MRTFDALQRASRRIAPMERPRRKPRSFATFTQKNAWEREEETRLARRAQAPSGISTSAEGELGIDLLFVAASRSFDDYRKHIVTRELEGVPVKVLDIDGMFMSKQTDRPEDIPDLQRLARLKGPGGRRR